MVCRSHWEGMGLRCTASGRTSASPRSRPSMLAEVISGRLRIQVVRMSTTITSKTCRLSLWGAMVHLLQEVYPPPNAPYPSSPRNNTLAYTNASHNMPENLIPFNCVSDSRASGGALRHRWLPAHAVNGDTHSSGTVRTWQIWFQQKNAEACTAVVATETRLRSVSPMACIIMTCGAPASITWDQT